MIDTVPNAGTHTRPCRVRATADEPAPYITRAADRSSAFDCPACHSEELSWAFRVEHPEFKSGAIACGKCGLMLDVTPRN